MPFWKKGYSCSLCKNSIEEIGVHPELHALSMFKNVMFTGTGSSLTGCEIPSLNEEILKDPILFRGFICISCNKVICHQCIKIVDRDPGCPECGRQAIPAFKPLLELMLNKPSEWKLHLKNSNKPARFIYDKEKDAREAAVENITDQAVLTEIAKNDKYPDVRIKAIKEITDQTLLAEIAKKDKDSGVRDEALKMIRIRSLLAGSAKTNIK